MNKRKTLRMTSILLALMMFFGMVSVLLVPSGVAAAADTEVVMDVDDSTTTSKTDTNNYVIAPQGTDLTPDEKFTLKVISYNKDLSGYDGLYMELWGPDDKVVKNYHLSDKRKMTKVDDQTYTYNMEIKFDSTTLNTNSVGFYDASKSPVTGLYYIKTYAYKEGSNDTVQTHTLPAFYFAQYYYAPTILTGAISSTKADDKYYYEADAKHYVGPGAKLAVAASVGTWNSIAEGEGRLINPFTGKTVKSVTYNAATNGATALANLKGTIEVPADAKDETKKRLAYLVLEDKDNNSLNKCWAVPLMQTAELSQTKVTAYQVTVDAVAPAVDSANVVIGYGPELGNYRTVKFNENFTFFEYFDRYNAANYTLSALKIYNPNDETSPLITDTGSGAAGLWDAYIANSAGGTSNYKIVGSSGSSLVVPNWNASTSTTVMKSGNNYRLLFRVEDNVGNKKDIYSGVIKVDDQYHPLTQVEAVTNVYNLVLGKKYTGAELKALLNVITSSSYGTATFPNAWRLNGGSLSLDYFDIEYEAIDDADIPANQDLFAIKSLTPKKVGETTGNLTSYMVFGGTEEALYDRTGPVSGALSTSPRLTYDPYVTSNNIYFRITDPAQPVTNITVSPKTKELAVGDKFTPVATVLPATATNPKIEWSSSNTAIATVDKDTGEVTAIADGTCQIYARSLENSGVQDHCEVTVGKKIVDPPTPGPAPEGWVDEGGNRFYYVDGQKVVGWRKIEGSWYFFDYSNAAMRAGGWLKEGGKWYYLNTNGTMKSQEWFKDNNGKWYWLKANGAMAAGWEKIQGTWYYFNASGAMQTGWVNVRGIWYYMKSSGAMYEGWLQDGGSWYYLTPGGGAMVTGRVTINGRASNFATSGRWLGYV